MKKKVFVLTLLCLILLFNPLIAYGSSLNWNIVNQDGSWETTTIEHPKTNWDNLYAVIEYNTNLTDFTLWKFKIKPTGDSSYLFRCEGKIYLTVENKGFVIDYSIYRTVFNVWQISYLLMWYDNGYSVWDTFYDSHVRYEPITFDVYFYRTTNNTLGLVIQHAQGKFTKEFDDIDLSNPTLTVKIEKIEGSSGYLEIFYSNEDFQNTGVGIEDPSPTWVWYQGIINAINGIFTKIYNALPLQVKNALDLFLTFFTFIYNNAVLVFHVLTTLASYGGIVYLLYWLHLIVKSLHEGSLEPILDHCNKVISLLSSIVQAIRSILPIP